AGDSVKVQFNDLINTDAAQLAAAIQVTTASGEPLPASRYRLEGVNTLAGGYVTLSFSENDAPTGQIYLQVTSGIRALNGVALRTPVQASYELVAGVRPVIDRVTRKFDNTLGSHYFHADGSELAVIEGHGFGRDQAAIKVFLGETQIPAQSIVAIDDDRLELKVPNLFLNSTSVTLPVRIEVGELAYIKQGAMVILPQVRIEDVNPLRGPPQGGNLIDLYGRGFSHATVVKIGGRTAGDLRVLGGHHIQVRVPAGAFGYAGITAESRLFPGESATAPVEYFYAGRETGSVDLDSDKPSPLAAVLLRDQILYAVTGGEYDVVTRDGRLAKKLRSNVARLVVADVADPVRPVILEKEFAESSHPYHFDVTGGLGTTGFVALADMDDNLFAAGGNSLFHFDLTLAADPLLLKQLELQNAIRDI